MKTMKKLKVGFEIFSTQKTTHPLNFFVDKQTLSKLNIARVGIAADEMLRKLKNKIF